MLKWNETQNYAKTMPSKTAYSTVCLAISWKISETAVTKADRGLGIF